MNQMNQFFLFVYSIKTAVPCGMLDISSKAKFGLMMTHFPPASDQSRSHLHLRTDQGVTWPWIQNANSIIS